MIRIGLTGGLGSGKTTVTAMFAELDAAVIDADAIVHDLIANDNDIRSRIVHAFGHEIVDAYGDIVRAKLAPVVFADSTQLQHLNAILHPPVIKQIQHLFQVYEKEKKYQAAVAEVPLLIEVGALDAFDTIVVVDCEYNTRLQRYLERTGETKESFEQRERFQMDLTDKRKYANYVIDNNKTIEEVFNQVKCVWKKILSNSK